MFRTIKAEITIPANLSHVYSSFITEKGVKSFFAPDCNVNPIPGGNYELFFDPDAKKGSRGSEGMIFLALQENTMISFSWNNPPHLSSVRNQMTTVTIFFDRINEKSTHVELRHTGWGKGNEWDSAFEYFNRVWQNVVLFRLKHRFEKGPLDWNHLPG